MAILALEINKRQPFADGRSFGATGPYEQIDGAAHFGVDPTHPDNRGIADIALAPRDTTGLVRFAADVTILTPREPEHGNRRLLLEVPNRGNRLAMRLLNCAPPAVPGTPIDPGDGFLMRQGYTVAWCGWQHDVPDVPGLMRASVPEAQAAEGGPVRGPLMLSFQPTAASQVQVLSDRAHRPYPAADLDDAHAVLLEREADDAPPMAIPREPTGPTARRRPPEFPFRDRPDMLARLGMALEGRTDPLSAAATDKGTGAKDSFDG